LKHRKNCVFSGTVAKKYNARFKITYVHLQQIDSNTYLGITIDSALNWKEHIDYMYTIRN